MQGLMAYVIGFYVPKKNFYRKFKREYKHLINKKQIEFALCENA